MSCDYFLSHFEHSGNKFENNERKLNLFSVTRIQHSRFMSKGIIVSKRFHFKYNENDRTFSKTQV